MYRSQESFKLLENFCIGVVVHNSASEVIFANQAALDLLGLTLDQIRGKTATDPRWKFIREDFSNILVEDFPVQLVLSSKKPIKDIVIGIIRPDQNNPVWALCNGSPVFDENGNLKDVIINFTDISDRKRISQELVEVADKLRMAYEISNIGVWNWNIESDAITWSKEMYQIAGLDSNKPAPSFSNQKLMYSPKCWSELQSVISNTLKTGDPYEFELELILPDGTHRNILAFGGVKRDFFGKITDLYGTTQDITEKKQVEVVLKAAADTAKKANEIKSKFLDIAAHELRTPVTAFSLLLQILKKKLELNEVIDEFIVNRLLKQSERMSKLVVELLDVSRLDRGIFSLKIQKVDITTLISECLDDFALRYPERKLIFNKQPTISTEVNVDTVRIMQVLSNYVDNAIKHTPSDSPIEVEVTKSESCINVCVKDKGRGVPEDLLQVLFQPFSRGTDDISEQAGGLGLGLYISKEIISLHGGKVWVESKPGEGSRFYFSLLSEESL